MPSAGPLEVAISSIIAVAPAAPSMVAAMSEASAPALPVIAIEPAVDMAVAVADAAAAAPAAAVMSEVAGVAVAEEVAVGVLVAVLVVDVELLVAPPLGAAEPAVETALAPDGCVFDSRSKLSESIESDPEHAPNNKRLTDIKFGFIVP